MSNLCSEFAILVHQNECVLGDKGRITWANLGDRVTGED